MLMTASLDAIAATSPPNLIHECEQIGPVQNCGTWKWNGREYDARWDNGSVGKITVERFDTEIVMRRADASGPSAGLSATYRGKSEGSTPTEGTVKWVLRGNNFDGVWSIANTGQSAERPPAGLPVAADAVRTMVVWGGRVGFGVWSVHGTAGTARWQNGTTSQLKVERFDQTVKIHRIDPNGGQYDFYGTLREGRMSGSGDGTVQGRALHADWAGTLESTGTPMDNGIPFNFSNSQQPADLMPESCDIDHAQGMPPNNAWQKGMNAELAKQTADASCWFQVAALHGEVKAQSLIGYFLMIGKGVAKNEAQGFNWIKQAAERGDAFAQLNLAKIYEQGLGTAPDHVKAVYWLQQAQALPPAPTPPTSTQMQQADMAAMGLVLGMFMGAMLFDTDTYYCHQTLFGGLRCR